MGRTTELSTDCPCGSGRALDDCCGPYIDGATPAPTAEALMRSRYAAFALGRADYLRATWHPDTRPSRVRLDPEQRWIGLSIKATQDGQAGDIHGVVEFVARFKVAGRGYRLHERSRFECIDGRWYYRDGEHL